MELHTYAKRKASKKWTIDQKRKLVEARIIYDPMFANMPTNSVLPWKKIVSVAKLDDHNVFFVRKQWSNMVARYKQYKESRLGNVPTKAIDEDMIRKMTEEWEFFRPIHRFMTRKTTNLHSYAMSTEDEPQQERQPQSMEDASSQGANNKIETQIVQEQLTSTSSMERMNVFSSDTNEDFIIPIVGQTEDIRTENTDHDFYSKTPTMQYYADASEDTQESMVVENGKELIVGAQQVILETKPMDVAHLLLQQQQQQKLINRKPLEHQGNIEPASTRNVPTKMSNGNQLRKPLGGLSERDKYYRHKRRFNRRLERRFDSMLSVFGQIVRAEYPSIDVSPLTGVAAASANLVKNLFSSDEELDSDEEQTTDADEMQSNNNVDAK